MSPVATQTITINAAFLQEIKEDNRELRELLKDAATVLSCRGRLARSVKPATDCISRLRDQLAMHFALEEAYGYFEDAVAVAPRLSEKADYLKSQHVTLFADICAIAEDCERLLYRENSSGLDVRIVARYDRFRQELREHESDETALIFQSLNGEVGVAD